MAELIATIIILFCLFVVPKIGEYKVNQRLEWYDMKNVDIQKLEKDKQENHLSIAEVRRNTVNGKYDFKPGEYNHNTKTRVK